MTFERKKTLGSQPENQINKVLCTLNKKQHEEREKKSQQDFFKTMERFYWTQKDQVLRAKELRERLDTVLTQKVEDHNSAEDRAVSLK